MKTANKVLCVFLAFAIIFGCMGTMSFAQESVKRYYYIDSVDGDDSNSGTDINSPV